MRKYRKGKRDRIINHFMNVTFFTYCLLFVKVAFFPIDLVDTSMAVGFRPHNNIIPFTSMWESVTSSVSPTVAMRQVGGNILLFIPLGFYLSFWWKRINCASKSMVMGMVFSLTIEVVQFILSLLLNGIYRVFDIDDVILNTLGFVIGFILFKMARPYITNSFAKKQLLNNKNESK